MRQALNAQILSAHAKGDTARLIELYYQASHKCKNIDEKCFFLTYAYVYALEVAHPLEGALYQALKKYNRV